MRSRRLVSLAKTKVLLWIRHAATLRARTWAARKRSRRRSDDPTLLDRDVLAADPPGAAAPRSGCCRLSGRAARGRVGDVDRDPERRPGPACRSVVRVERPGAE